MGQVNFILLAMFMVAIICANTIVDAIVCGQNPPRNANRGDISSPSYPNLYANNYRCSSIITVAANKAILFTFSTPFRLETNYDYLKVFEIDQYGSHKNTKSWTGNNVPSFFMSRTNRVELLFTSDQSNAGNGFRVFWEAFDRNQSENETCRTGDGNKTLTSPGYPDPYPENIDCKWDIEVQEDSIIRMHFKELFNVEGHSHCDADYLEIYDYTKDGSLIFVNRWCGNKAPPPHESMSSRVRLVFHSDQEKNLRGFAVEWESEVSPWSPNCGEIYVSSNGTVTSPGFPNPYPANLDCRWEIHVAQGHRIKLELGTPFDIETDDHGCRYDYVEVFDLLTNGSQVSKGRWCSVRKTVVIISTSSKLIVTFKSDYNKNGQGFTVAWETVDFPWSNKCGGIYNSPNGTFATPGYPNPYPANLDCRWEIHVTNVDRISLEFGTSFELETDQHGCGYDYVEIFDFLSNGTQISNGRWCGSREPPVFYSITSKMLVVFKSDLDKSKQGFTASWKTESSGSHCGYNRSSGAGHLLSPNFPMNYPENIKCHWELTPPVGTNIALQFDSLFDLELSNGCGWDYLQITLDNSVLSKWCGNNRPQNVSVDGGHRLEVDFRSDKSMTGKGFFASWTDDM